jgi:hypothetical protein
MTRLVTMMLKLKRLGFPIAMLVLFIASTDGFVALLQAQGWDPWRWGLAVLLAVLVDIMLAVSILEWHRSPSLSAGIAMLAFMAFSGGASVNLWYRTIRGAEKTTEIFDVQRDAVLRDLIIVRDRIAEAKSGLSGASAYSKRMADDEKSTGNTCGKSRGDPGPRQRFRDADANFFASLERDLSSIPPRISAEIDTVRALQPQPGKTLAADLGRLRLAVGNAESVLHDPALPRIAEALRNRIAEDTVDRREGKIVYNCADPAIRSEAGNVLARIQKLPTATSQVVVHDLTSPSETLSVFGLFNPKNWGEKGGLSVADILIIAFSVFCEFAAFWSGRGFARGLKPERSLEHLPAAIDFDPDTALRFIRALTDQPDPRVQWFCRVLTRYQASIGLHNRLFVAYGCTDQRMIDLAWAAPILVAIGWLKRDRWLPGLLVTGIARWKWPETRGCERRETFRIEQTVFDELHVAEVVARMREQYRTVEPGANISWAPVLRPAE